MWWFHDGSDWWMAFGALWMVVFWGVVAAVAIWAFRVLAGGRQETDSPTEIAKKRLARGEITLEQFEEIKKAL